MAIFNTKNIIETIEMIKTHHLDIRTVTLSLSLRDCADPDYKVCADKIYNKILSYSKNLSKFFAPNFSFIFFNTGACSIWAITSVAFFVGITYTLRPSVGDGKRTT